MTAYEKKISKFFDAESSSMVQRHEEQGLPTSAEIQIQDIISSGAASVVDIGSGPGSILLELFQQGLDQGIGVDLSTDMNKIARQRLAAKGFEDRAQIIEGSFLDVELGHTDAVSLHRVLCCHPDREALLEKAYTLTPRTITLTIPRDWKIMQLLVGIYGLFTRLSKSFRPFVHRQKHVDNQLTSLGYEIINREKSIMWVTTTYQRGADTVDHPES